MAEKNKEDQAIPEWLEEYLERKGSVAEVDEKFYLSFLERSDKEMRALIRLIIYGLSKEINRMVFDEKGRYKDADILKLIQGTLFLMSLGVMQFSDDGKLCMYKPQGPKPTREVKRRLEERVEKCVPLIRRALIEGLNRQARSR